MERSYLDIDYKIEISEKKNDQLKNDYDKIQGKISNVIIIYSAMSFFLYPVMEDFLKRGKVTDGSYASVETWFYIFIVLFTISLLSTVLLILPFFKVPKNHVPSYFYAYGVSSLKHQFPAITDVQIDEKLKEARLEELENSIKRNTIVFRRKRGLYNISLCFAVFSTLFFFVCVKYHIERDDKVTKINIENIDKFPTFTKDSSNCIKHDTIILRTKGKRKNGQKKTPYGTIINYNFFEKDSGSIIQNFTIQH